MNKVILISFFVICSAAYIQGNFIKDAANEAAYQAIHAALKARNPDEPEKNQCIVDDFRKNNVADKFWSPDLLFNNEKLQREIQPYADAANLKCEIIVFFQSPYGIAVLVGLLIFALCIICCLIKCICC